MVVMVDTMIRQGFAKPYREEMEVERGRGCAREGGSSHAPPYYI
jgi:hypothetical protein